VTLRLPALRPVCHRGSIDDMMRPVPPRRWSKRGSRPALPRLVEPGVHVVRGTPRFEAKLCGSCPARGRGTRVGVTRCLPTGRGPGLRSPLLLVHDPETRRALQFETLAAVLPIERRDRLGQLLIDDDFATQKRLAQEGRQEHALPCPASQGLVSKFMGAPSLGSGRPSPQRSFSRPSYRAATDSTRWGGERVAAGGCWWPPARFLDRWSGGYHKGACSRRSAAGAAAYKPARR
jgi:hypothetical protein